MARQMNSLGLYILKEAGPEPYIKGIIIRQARRFLKKITSKICISSEDFRMKTPMKLKKKIDKRINTIALFWDGKVLKYSKGCQNIICSAGVCLKDFLTS